MLLGGTTAIAMLMAAGIEISALPAYATPIQYGWPTNPLRLPGTYSPGQKFGAPRPYGTHKGADFDSVAANPVPIFSVAEGIVHDVYTNTATGNCVMILNADGVYARYCHLALPVALPEGSSVSRGSQIGRMGATGSAANGRHLHLEFAFTPTNSGVHNFDPVPYIQDRLTVQQTTIGKADMLMIYLPGSPWKFALFGPNFWYEWTGASGADPLGSAFIAQITGGSVIGGTPVNASQWAAIKAATGN